MKYAILIYEPETDFQARIDPTNETYWRAYGDALGDKIVGGDPLQPPGTATTVRLADGKRLVQDGPFADTKEQLGGFMIIEVPDLDAALEWAARCPAASSGVVEVRPVLPMGED